METASNRFEERKILIVDDEPHLILLVKEILQQNGYQKIETAASIKEAEYKMLTFHPELLILDVMLPDGDGFGLLKKIRRSSDIPVIFLSARDEDENRLKGLGVGADDYITKPFLPKELLLRVSGLLKRAYPVRETLIQLGTAEVDFASGMVRKKNANLTLTATEYRLLKKLAENRGHIITIEGLCQTLWEEESYGYENTLVVHIRRLREKIEEDPSHPKYLLTVRGLGYKLI